MSTCRLRSLLRLIPFTIVPLYYFSHKLGQPASLEYGGTLSALPLRSDEQRFSGRLRSAIDAPTSARKLPAIRLPLLSAICYVAAPGPWRAYIVGTQRKMQRRQKREAAQ